MRSPPTGQCTWTRIALTFTGQRESHGALVELRGRGTRIPDQRFLSSQIGRGLGSHPAMKQRLSPRASFFGTRTASAISAATEIIVC
jgi:hypothetical protein